MTNEQLKKYIKFKAEQLQLTTQSLDETLGTVVEMSLEEFWNAFPWAWKCKQAELPVTTQAEQYDLPADFSRIRTVRDKSPINGRKLRFIPLERFRDRFPKPQSVAAGDPRFYSIISLATGNASKIMFFPIPTARTIYYEYLVETPPTLDKIPSEALSGIRLLAESMLHQSGSESQAAARRLYERELLRLQTLDSPYGALDNEMLDDSQEAEQEGVPLFWVPNIS